MISTIVVHAISIINNCFLFTLPIFSEIMNQAFLVMKIIKETSNSILIDYK